MSEVREFQERTLAYNIAKKRLNDFLKKKQAIEKEVYKPIEYMKIGKIKIHGFSLKTRCHQLFDKTHSSKQIKLAKQAVEQEQIIQKSFKKFTA